MLGNRVARWSQEIFQIDETAGRIAVELGRGSADRRTGSAEAESMSSLSNRLNRREVLDGHYGDTVGRRKIGTEGERTGGGEGGGGGAAEEVKLSERASEGGLLRGGRVAKWNQGGERQIVCIPITTIIILHI
jgi:hypothetical protein